MDKRTIIFRADGNSNIGMGHFIRTLALAEMLKDNFHCTYITQSPSAYQINAIKKVCHSQIELPRDDTHFDIFLDYIKGDEIVVLDNYYFTTEFQQQIKNKGCKLVCIDDMHDKHFIADLIINHAEGISKYQYSAEKYTDFCLGFEYALLRPNYLNNVANKLSKKYSCLVMMGGADPHNLTEKIVSILQQLNLGLPLSIIVGPNFKEDYLLKSYNNIEFHKGIESSKVYQLMQESQLGIFPASTVAIESCAARLPFICGYFINNQKEMYIGIKSNYLALCIGNYLEVLPNELITAVEQISQTEISEKIIQNQKAFLDKKSKERFIKIFNNLWKL